MWIGRNKGERHNIDNIWYLMLVPVSGPIHLSHTLLVLCSERLLLCHHRSTDAWTHLARFYVCVSARPNWTSLQTYLTYLGPRIGGAEVLTQFYGTQMHTVPIDIVHIFAIVVSLMCLCVCMFVLSLSPLASVFGTTDQLDPSARAIWCNVPVFPFTFGHVRYCYILRHIHVMYSFLLLLLLLVSTHECKHSVLYM